MRERERKNEIFDDDDDEEKENGKRNNQWLMMFDTGESKMRRKGNQLLYT